MYTVCADLTTHHGHKVEECRKSWFERQFLIVALGTEIRVPLGGKIGALARDYSFVSEDAVLAGTGLRYKYRYLYGEMCFKIGWKG